MRDALSLFVCILGLWLLIALMFFVIAITWPLVGWWR